MFFAIDRKLRLDTVAEEVYQKAIKKGILDRDAPDDYYEGPSGVKFDRCLWKVKVSKQDKRIYGNKKFISPSKKELVLFSKEANHEGIKRAVRDMKRVQAIQLPVSESQFHSG